MSFERVATTKGMLQKAREQLGFIERGKDVLKLKRDQVAGELNKLLGELGRRKSVERLFADAFESVKYAYAVLGYDSFASAAASVGLIEARALPTSAVGVIMPEVKVVKKPDPVEVPSATMMKAAAKLSRAVEEAIQLAVLEAKVEQLARELMDTNRKVNALEKVVIPGYKATIRYIEERLNEQALQEFFVTKRMRDITRVNKERSPT
jgi:V/A-type H+-transporting ATPase subunit D